MGGYVEYASRKLRTLGNTEFDAVPLVCTVHYNLYDIILQKG